MDYQHELDAMQASGNKWKPKHGQFKVKALSELEESEPFVKKTKDEYGNPQEESSPQFQLKIEVEGEEKVWVFGKGYTLASTYGQIIKLASEHNNHLTSVEFTVAVKSDGTKNDYTIVG